ncbi:hypothetical protein DB347_20755 [Opitutaceae bacterium EW11]|nr:hypothetical protein DB347_20755 [Opitutaceae bacterium EW11]
MGPPNQLFHYTSQEGILGITRSKSIWATKIQFLNDRSEFFDAFEYARSELKSHASEANDAATSRLVDHAIQQLECFEALNVFVASFSEVPDLLSQWRGYSKNSVGYCLGFDAEMLKSTAEAGDFRLGRCVYEHQPKRDYIRQILAKHWARFAEARGKPDFDFFICRDEFSEAFCRDVIDIAPLWKSASFQEEREWRLVSPLIATNNSRCDFRNGKHSLIPYYSLELKPARDGAYFALVLVGPTREPSLAAKAVTSLFSRYGVKARGVRASKIPFREV